MEETNIDVTRFGFRIDIVCIFYSPALYLL